MVKKLLWKYCVVLFVFLLTVGGCLGWGKQDVPAISKEKIKAPYVEVPIINSEGEDEAKVDSCKIGKTRNDGKYMIVLFWTTWCPHCVDAMWQMNTYAKAYSEKFAFCAVALDNKSNVSRYLKRRKLFFPVAIDEAGVSAYLYQVMGVPTIVIISPDGNIWDYGYNLEGMVDRLVKRKLSA